MRKWKLYLNAIFLVLILLLPTSRGDVALRVLLRPPIVSLECLIVNVNEKASVIMMCPNDIMCFQNCTPLCDSKCAATGVQCSMSLSGRRIKYTYTFDTTNLSNQGEWTCHFGNEQSSTIIFFNNTDQNTPSTTSTTSRKPTLFTEASNSSKIIYSLNSKYAAMVTTSKTEHPVSRHTFAIVLIILLFASICVNIWLIIRSVKHKSINEKSMTPNVTTKRSWLFRFCSKFFFIEQLFKKRSEKGSSILTDDKQLLHRQFSNNIYEMTPSSHIPPAIVLDNYSFASTPTTLKQGLCSRSTSCPCKSADHDCGPYNTPETLLKSASTRPQFYRLINRPGGMSPIVYDDVADQTMGYLPLHYFTPMSIPSRPSQYFSSNGNLDTPLPGSSMSMNNLAATYYRLPEVSDKNELNKEETLLKDAINSRVELSKEMINQADTLLKRADRLLNDKDDRNNTSN